MIRGRRWPPSGGLLIEADHVSPRIPEPRSNLGRVRADGLHDLATIGDDSVNGRGHTIDHDVQEEARRSARWASEHPCAAHFSYGVVEGCAAVAAFPDVPAE